MNCFIILGMHRSATSFISEGLIKIDVNMGDNLLKDHFEDIDFLNMNEQILAEAKGSWNNPPSEKEIIKAGRFYTEQIKTLIEKKNKSEMWGWKDPRTCLTIKCYMPYLINPFFINCFRSYKEIAKSLQKRDGTSIEFGIELAEIYNKRVLDFLNEWSKND